MSENLQFEFHPDGDQISAFVEHALPGHEREQMLEHLAVCAECRAIVALSLPELEAPAQPRRAAPAKRWWTGWGLGWNLAWPIAAALAAGALFVVYVRHTAVAPNRPGQQVAVEHSPALPAAQERSATPAAKAIAKGPQAAPAGSHAASAGMEALAPEPKLDAPRAGQSVGGPILTGRNFAALRPAAAPPVSTMENSLTAKESTLPPGLVLNNSAGGGIGVGSATVAKARPQEALPSPQAEAANPILKSEKAAAPAATVSVVTDNSAPIETVNSNADSNEMALAEVRVSPLMHALPSNLPVFSMARQAQRVVAIDTGHAVFASKDGGKHWKAIPLPWQGRAVEAALVEPAAGSVTPMRLRDTVIAGAEPGNGKALSRSTNGPLATQGPLASAGEGSSLTGTVTDLTGALIAGASVTVTDTATGAARTVTTDGAGRYIADGLAPGAYRVEALARGFTQEKLPAVVVSSAGQSTANLSLKVGASTETVMVQAGSADVNASQKTRAKAATSKRSAPVFEIVTDSGEHWTSADGMTWRRN